MVLGIGAGAAPGITGAVGGAGVVVGVGAFGDVNGVTCVGAPDGSDVSGIAGAGVVALGTAGGTGVGWSGAGTPMAPLEVDCPSPPGPPTDEVPNDGVAVVGEP